MSMKIHMLHSHLDSFPENCGDYSDEQGERFHQDLARFEDNYKGKKLHVNMLANYCDSITREAEEGHKKNRARKRLRFEQ